MIFYGSHQNFMKNGKLLLEERVALFHGKTNPIRCLSIHDLNTKFEDWVFREDCGIFGGNWYQCVWEGRSVLAKLFMSGRSYLHEEDCSMIFREIAVATQMGVHNNVHRLLACCLETKLPVLIYELVEHGCLKDILHGWQVQMAPHIGWKDRLRIAWEISHAVAYLHSAFPRPIIHRDLNPRNVLLDQDKSAKLTGFHLTVSIPEGELYVEDRVVGTFYYVDPDYVRTATLAENADVYAFGMLFLELLTGVEPRHVLRVLPSFAVAVTNKHFTEVVDPVIIRDGMIANEALQQQLQACTEVMVKCIARERDSRPTMEEVAAELKNIITGSEPSIPTTSTATLSRNLSLSRVQFVSMVSNLTHTCIFSSLVRSQKWYLKKVII